MSKRSIFASSRITPNPRAYISMSQHTRGKQYNLTYRLNWTLQRRRSHLAPRITSCATHIWAYYPREAKSSPLGPMSFRVRTPSPVSRTFTYYSAQLYSHSPRLTPSLMRSVITLSRQCTQMTLKFLRSFGLSDFSTVMRSKAPSSR